MRALLVALLASFASLVAIAPPVAAGCTPESGIGLARIVDIDTTTGPLYGVHTGYQRQPSFLQPKEVVLTFDDGPMPWITRSILDTLDNHCTKATFFSVGRMAIAYPATTREILARGHTLGTHTWSHPLNLKRLKAESATDEIEKGFAAVALAAGQPIAPFFRFPGLNDNAALLTHLQGRGVGTFTVDAISNDSYILDEARLVAHTLAQVEARQGGIVLFHDIKAATARALPVILTQLKARGFTVVHMRASSVFTPDPRYAAQLQPLLAKAQAPAKGNLMPFYGAALRPGADTATPESAAVPVTAIAPEAKTFLARATEAGSGRPGVKRPLLRTARAEGTTGAAQPASTPALRPQRPQQPRYNPQPVSSGWFGSMSGSGWVTTVAPPPRLRRSAVD